MITRSKSLLQLLQDLAIVMDPSQAAIVYGHRAVRYVRKPSATHAHAQSVREVGLAENSHGNEGNNKGPHDREKDLSCQPKV